MEKGVLKDNPRKISVLGRKEGCEESVLSLPLHPKKV